MTRRRFGKKPQRAPFEPFQLPGYHVFFDGCCEPHNPGGAMGWGVAIFHTALPNKNARTAVLVAQLSDMVDASADNSNNVAEYMAINAALTFLDEREGATGRAVYVYGDSKLVIEQLWGTWKIRGVDFFDEKPGRYASHAVTARERLKRFAACRGRWIPRAENAHADMLSKSHLRKAGIEFRLQPEENGDVR